MAIAEKLNFQMPGALNKLFDEDVAAAECRQRFALGLLERSLELLLGPDHAHASTTAVPMLAEVVQPDSDPLLYGDNADVVEAMKANQIDAALFDLPTALYLSAVVLDDGALLGQFPADRSRTPDQFGMLLEEGNPLKSCVDAAIDTLTENGTLADLEATWLSETTGVPVIE